MEFEVNCKTVCWNHFMNSRHLEKSVCSGTVIEELKVARALGHAWLCCPDAGLKEKLSLLLKATVESR